MKNTNYINDYDFVKQLIEKGNVKRVFDVVNYRMRGDMLRPHILKVEYSDCAFLIFNLVSKFGDGFVVDICDRVLESIHACREIQISDKQRWCVAFALLKVTSEQVDAYGKEVSAMLREDPEIAEEKNEDEQEGDVVASTPSENASADAPQKNTVTRIKRRNVPNLVAVESHINAECIKISYEGVPRIYHRPKQAIGSIAVYR